MEILKKMAEDKDSEEGFVEVDGEKFKEDPENTGETLKDEEGNPIPFEDQSKETEEESITAADAMRFAQNLQKGYTMTRQDMAVIRENQQRIQEALESIKKDREGGDDEEEEPLTIKKFLNIQEQQRKEKQTEDVRLNQEIDRQLDELRVQGIVKTEEDEKALLDFAVKRKIANLSNAAVQWKEIEDAKKEARKEGLKEGLKGKVKAEAGSKIGTSQKAGTKEQGIDYDEIASKSIDELAQG